MPPTPPRRFKIVLVVFGTHGDLHPFLALALALKQRGAEPVLAAAETYRYKVEAEGIAFRCMRPDVAEVVARLDMDEQTLARKIARRPQFLLEDVIMPSLRESYEDSMAASVDADAMVIHSVAYGARLAAEKRRLPSFGIVLQPLMFMSVSDPPLIADFPRLSRWVYRLGPRWTRVFFALGKRRACRWARPIDRLRREIGLVPATAHPLFEGQFGSNGTIALYSPLFGAAQPDHPPRTLIAGFAFYDSESGGSATIAPDLQLFLDAGAPPIVFTQGTSAVHDAEDFVRESLAAVRLLGTRAVIVLDEERARRWAPQASESILITGYTPYSLLFPRACVIVHHGGIGTTAQALRAGRPQLISPYLVDQPDNAARVAKLGAGRSLPPEHWHAPAIAAALRTLIKDPHYAQRARRIARQLAAEDGAVAAADFILESLEIRHAAKNS